MTYDLLGFLLISVIALSVGAACASRPRFPLPRRLFMLAILLRILGSLARYEVLDRYYRGIGDAIGYYHSGLAWARRLWRFDLSLLAPEQWFGESGYWWGTAFVKNLSGMVISVIGPTMRGEFLVFSLLAFSGLSWMALAVHRIAGRRVADRFAALVWLWPSLWFWPSSVGKEAVIILGIGLTVLGFAARAGRIQWVPFAVGLAITFAIRPHVALALVLAATIATWMGSWRRWTPRRAVQAAAILFLAVVTFGSLRQELGLGDADLEGFQEFVSYRAQQTLTGGSSLGEVPSGALALPMALVNTWLRPLPWDIHNVMALASGVEILMLWLLIWSHRKSLRAGLRRWRQHRLLQLALPFVLGYTLMIGVTFGNLGIIARQRTPLFPFLFLLVVGQALLAAQSRRGLENVVLGRRPPGRAWPTRAGGRHWAAR